MARVLRTMRRVDRPGVSLRGGNRLRSRESIFFVILLGSASAALAVVQAARVGEYLTEYPSVAAWVGLSIFVAVLPFKRIIGIRSVSFTPVPLLAVLLLYGTGAAVLAGWLAGIAATVSSRTGKTITDIERAVIFSGKHVVALLVAGCVLAGAHPNGGTLASGFGAGVFVRLLVAYAVFAITKAAVVAAERRLRDRSGLIQTWKANVARGFPLTLLVPIGTYFLALAYDWSGPLLIFMIVAIAIARILTIHDRSQISCSFASLVDALRFVRLGDTTHLMGETEREAALAVAIGQKMRLPQRNMALLERAAVLHNLGYIMADKKAILKPTKLTTEEIEALKQHPYNSMMILRKVDGTEAVGDIVHCHHESPDGTGYPRGISGGDIPLEASIVKVAEAFVAMTSPRVYRRTPLSRDAALDEIAEATGSCFDPIVVYFLLDMAGRNDLVSRVSGRFGSPTRKAIEERLYRPRPRARRVLLPAERRRSLLWGSCLTAAAFASSFILTELHAYEYLRLPPNLITSSFPSIAFLLALLGFSTLRPVRLPWGAGLTWAPAIVITVALAGGPLHASIFGLGFIGWSMLINPSAALAAGGYSTGRGDLAGRNMLPLTKRKIRRAPLQPAVAYGLMLMLAGSSAWAAYRMAIGISGIAALGWLPSGLLSFILAVGSFYAVETVAQPAILRSTEITSWRLWQRDYRKIFPEPLSYAAFGYAIFLGTNLLGVWIAVALFLLPAVWRQYILRGVVDSQQVSDSLIRAVARTVDEKDLYTGGHSANVAEIAAEIAREMGKSESFVETIEDAAIRHDLGKASWPDQVLRKPTSFDDKELELYKWTHPDVGAEIAILSGSSPEVIEMIRCHHEYHDGCGYRRGISGDQIPLGARIISIADSFDAMIHDRSHRDRLSISEALEEIRRNSATQFDPMVVDAFFRVINRIDLEELALRVRFDSIERPKRNTSGCRLDRSRSLP